MKDSTLDPRWLSEMMRVNPPRRLENGNILTGPVRLAFPSLFKPKAAMNQQAAAGNSSEGRFGAAVLWPLGADLTIFSEEWVRVAREAFPKNWTPDGKPVGLHSPFHDQAEKAIGAKPLAGYTPGAITCNVTSNFKPQIVDMNMNPIVDEARVYPGVWAILAVNAYKYGPPQPKSGVAFGLQSAMIIADDQKLGGGGSDPRTDFAQIAITPIGDIAARIAAMPGVPAAGPASAGILPIGGHQGAQGALPVQPLPAAVNAAEVNAAEVNAADLY